MNRYPDEIVIFEPNYESNPYKHVKPTPVYRGRCRCFLDRQAAFRTNRVMDCSYQVVIPDRNMIEIGENFKVGVKMHTNKGNRNWDLVGYVKDFARYDRVCNLYFQMVKENLIYEDVPPAVINPEVRVLNVADDEWFHMESVGLVEPDIFMEDELISFEFLRAWDAETETYYHPEFYVQNSEGEWVDIYAQELFTDYQRKDTVNTVYVLVCKCQIPIYEVEYVPYQIRIEIWTGMSKASRGELVSEREITIMPKVKEE